MELVSVIIPSYNREKTIERAIKSVLNQTYLQFEIIVVDDASSDNTVKTVKKIDDDRIRIIVNQRNQGACYSRNVGIEESRGNYVSFLDSDDEWDKDFLKMQVEALKEGKYDVSCCGFVRIRNDNEERVVKDGFKEKIYYELLGDNFITTGTIVAKKEVFKQEKFNLQMPRYQDWELMLRVSKKYNVNYINKPLLIQYHQSDSITSCASGEKTQKALNIIIRDNIDALKMRPTKLAQLYWWMGMASIDSDKLDIRLFRYAVKYDKKGKYILTYIFLSLGGFRIIKYIHSKRLKKWRQ